MGVKRAMDDLDQGTFKNSLCIAMRSQVLFPDCDLGSNVLCKKKTVRKCKILSNDVLKVKKKTVKSNLAQKTKIFISSDFQNQGI